MCSISVAATVLLIASDLNEETLVCRADGNPPPHVTWIGPDGEVTKTSTGEARISLGNLGQGKYTCKATNALGSDQKSYIVTRKDFFWPVAFCCFYLLNYLLLLLLLLLSFMSVLSCLFLMTIFTLFGCSCIAKWPVFLLFKSFGDGDTIPALRHCLARNTNTFYTLNLRFFWFVIFV